MSSHHARKGDNTREEILSKIKCSDEPISFEALNEAIDDDDEERLQKELMELVDGNKIAITADWNYKYIDRNNTIKA